ncbi:Hpt domain-containing protein [Photobacterium ganghwense]|nr:Hpt domain-containing protein [Photobacterium ganghwense]
MKGVAGSLGARALKEVAAHIEAQYKHQQPVTLDDCNALSRVLNDTMDSARRYTVDVFEGA